MEDTGSGEEESTPNLNNLASLTIPPYKCQKYFIIWCRFFKTAWRHFEIIMYWDAINEKILQEVSFQSLQPCQYQSDNENIAEGEFFQMVCNIYNQQNANCIEQIMGLNSFTPYTTLAKHFEE